MKLVPVPLTDEMVRQLSPHWFPFLAKIAQRSKEPIQDLFDKIMDKRVQAFLIWDEPANKAVAMLGISYHMRGDDLIAKWEWMTGTGRKAWEGLLPELEKYLTEHVGCDELRPVCRPGWSRILKPYGYRVTHYVMEKRLKEPPHG